MIKKKNEVLDFINTNVQSLYYNELVNYLREELINKLGMDLIDTLKYDIEVIDPLDGMDIYVKDPDLQESDFFDFQDLLMIAHNHPDDVLYTIMNYPRLIEEYIQYLLSKPKWIGE